MKTLRVLLTAALLSLYGGISFAGSFCSNDAEVVPRNTGCESGQTPLNVNVLEFYQCASSYSAADSNKGGNPCRFSDGKGNAVILDPYATSAGDGEVNAFTNYHEENCAECGYEGMPRLFIEAVDWRNGMNSMRVASVIVKGLYSANRYSCPSATRGQGQIAPGWSGEDDRVVLADDDIGVANAFLGWERQPVTSVKFCLSDDPVLVIVKGSKILGAAYNKICGPTDQDPRVWSIDFKGPGKDGATADGRRIVAYCDLHGVSAEVIPEDEVQDQESFKGQFGEFVSRTGDDSCFWVTKKIGGRVTTVRVCFPPQ